MIAQCLAVPPRKNDGGADSGDLAFNLVQILENARFDLESDREKAKASIAKVSFLLGLELLPSQAVMSPPIPNGGLAHWQALRIQQFVDRQIDRNISVSELSRYIHLSSSHFARAFKKTFMETPHSYVLRRRVAHAKHLLVSKTDPLHEIALSCGFSDQAHLCKAFRRLVGETPANWRRYRRQVISTSYNGFGGND